MSQERPRITGLLESALYVRQVERSVDFYRSVFGFEALVIEERFAALSVAGKQVLLLFEIGAAAKEGPSKGGTIPAHDARGEVHLAFSIEAGKLAGWEESLRKSGVSVESKVRWPRGGTSLYLRDPDRHLVELATPGIWAVY